MKCKNCGAQYKTRELKCPYCNTENLIGKIWQTERTQAELEYEEEKKKVGKVLFSPYMADRLLSRAIVVLIGLHIVSFALIFIVIALSYPFQKLLFFMNKEKIEAQMEEYYQAGEYEKLDVYMEENYVDNADYYTYAQATLMTFDYNNYMEHRLAFEALPQEEKLLDDYHLKYALKHSVEVYKCECGIYKEPDERNMELYERRQKEVRAYWVGELLLTEEEIDSLISANYISDSEIMALSEKIKERRYQ